MTPTEFVSRYASVARVAAGRTGLPISVLVAQWAWETGWGENLGAREGNNLAGIKYVPGVTVAGGRPGSISTEGDAYAYYDSYEAFVQDYARVLGLSIYAGVRAAAAAAYPDARARAVAVARALAASPWVTGVQGGVAYLGSDGVSGGGLVDVIESNNLLALDSVPVVAVPLPIAPTAAATGAMGRGDVLGLVAGILAGLVVFSVVAGMFRRGDEWGP